MRSYWPLVSIIIIILLFFYKTVIFGKIPFPGDLLLSEYAPWRHASYFGYAPGAIPSKAQYFDVVRELYPWKTLVIDQLKKFQIPLWNPYNFSGTPLLANYQSQVFYPLGILYFILPQKTAWTVLLILQPILGSVFLYLFATEIGLSATAGLLAALLFNFSSFANVWMEFNTVWHTILWLPLLLYLLERSIREKKIPLSRKLIFIFVLFSSITGGHPQDFIDTFIFLSVYEIIRLISIKIWTPQFKRTFIIQLFSMTIIPFLLAGPQLLPTIELFRLSSRVPHDLAFILTTMLVQWWQLPMLIVQDFFGNPATHSYFLLDTYVNKSLSIGVTGFILVAASLFQKKRGWHQKFFIGVVLTVLLLTVNTPFALVFYRFPIPILSTGSPTRILWMLALAFSILAGFGFDRIKELSFKQFIPPLIVSFMSIGILWVITLIHPSFGNVIMNTTTTKHALIIATGIIICLSFLLFIKHLHKFLVYGIILITIFELAYSFMKFNPFVPQEFMYPSHAVLTYLQTYAGINRYWGYGTTRMESNLNAQYQLYTTDGTDPLNLALYNKLIQASSNGKIAEVFDRTTRSDVAIVKGYGPTDLPDNQYRLRLMDLLGVKYVLDRFDNPKNNTTFSADHFSPVYSTQDGYTIYRNVKALPRAFLADSVITYASDSQFEKLFFDTAFNPQTTVLVPATSTIPKTEQTEKKVAAITSYTPNSVEIRASTDKPQILFLSDTFAPGWNATIDNKPTPILLADYAFRAVALPPGDHIVRFVYWPRSFELGLVAMVIGILMTISVVVLDTLKRNG